jgi:hypothetical protein
MGVFDLDTNTTIFPQWRRRSLVVDVGADADADVAGKT